MVGSLMILFDIVAYKSFEYGLPEVLITDSPAEYKLFTYRNINLHAADLHYWCGDLLLPHNCVVV